MNILGKIPPTSKRPFVRILTFFLQGWVIALLLGTGLFFALRFSPDPYIFVQKDISVLNRNSGSQSHYYFDLNRDGRSETIILNNFADSLCGILVRDGDNHVRGQWNFLGNFKDELFKINIADFNHDGKCEIATVTIHCNKLLLNVIEPYGEPEVLVRDFDVDTVSTRNRQPTSLINWMAPADLNHNGTDEIVFSYSAGYGRLPRKVYSYDLKCGILRESPSCGSYLADIFMIDPDGNGPSGITGTCHSPNNFIDETICLQDSFSWFVVLDEELNYKVPPVKLTDEPSVTWPIVLPGPKGPELFVYLGSNSENGESNQWFRVLPDYGLERITSPIGSDSVFGLVFVKPSYGTGGAFYVPFKPGNVIFVDPTGDIHVRFLAAGNRRASPILNPSAGPAGFAYLLQEDGASVDLVFYDPSGRRHGALPEDDDISKVTVGWIGKVGKHYQFYVCDSRYNRIFEVRPNPNLYLRFLWWLLFVAGFYGFIRLIRYNQAREINRRESLKREMLELQMKAVKNQLDPHFTFNALNGLSYLALTGDSARMSNYIGNFSRLLRIHLNHSDQVLIPLGEELDFVRNYVDLQQLRFEGRLDFSKDIDPDVDLFQQVPKMMLQTHVENAFKHGLRLLLQDSGSRMGRVALRAFTEGQDTILVIEDNGTGRGSGDTPEAERSGRGLKALEQIYANIRLLYRIEISQNIEDLFDPEGNPSGTRIRIRIRHR